MTTTNSTAALREALRIVPDGDEMRGAVTEGWDVFGITHGGYVTALLGAAALEDSGAPDILTVTVHFLRKLGVGPVRLRATTVGGSRRFTSLHLDATQDDRVVATAIASVGDRGTVDGPTHTPAPWEPTALTPPAGDPALPFQPPVVAQRFDLRLDEQSVAFAVGRREPGLPLRAVMDTDEPDQLTALLACDITPPAVWNTLGSEGWVPTLELTAHVRARPAPGPLRIQASTTHVTDGLLEEDALVHDATGRLVVQSRQLALWSGA